MDSANSGSLQSSSGGDDEYDSRAADSVSTFMSGGGGGSGSGGHIPQPSPSFFDPLSGYLQLHQNTNPSSLLNSNISWPRTTTAPPLRSDPNPMGHHEVMFPTSNPFMPCFQPMGADSAAQPPPPPLNQSQAAARNPKKRSRASRRAPTTVLTTDTSNFRAMVQEFTGIPAPPFNSSSFPRSRLDFFGSRSTAFDAPQPPPYLRRPFAQKVQPPHPFLASSDAPNSNINTTAAASSSTASMNYQLPMTQNSSNNLFNIPNQNLLTSLLQSNPKFPFSTSSINTTKPQNSYEIPSNHDQFSLNHTNHNQVSETLAALPNLIPSDHNDAGADVSNAARWTGDKDDDDRLNLRPLSYDFQRSAMDGKAMSFAASSTSGFHGGKAPETTAAAGGVRGEGMVESWICSSE